MRIMLRVSYDGREYCGWQFQPGEKTIEGQLNMVLSNIYNTDIKVIGASRTDAGVHSLGNVCVFDVDQSKIPVEKLPYVMNNALPQDIRVWQSLQVDDDFHPRHTNSLKTYEYRIWNADFPDPVKRYYTHFTYRKLDVEKMREAAALLVGEHDFAAFVSAGSQAQTTVRTIYSIDIIEEYPDNTLNINNSNSVNSRLIVIRVKGSGFLYNMVRIIAGTLMSIGSGLKDVNDISLMLESGKREYGGETAPACGLTMIGIEFL
ncbi:MAG: tRNA pseudouridine(38-40) synthase TruA [Eubacterium sp.]|nr:tRNA pseudouridine(38-40) synthase TruA [Eubacterium sp.]